MFVQGSKMKRLFLIVNKVKLEKSLNNEMKGFNEQL